jgi:DNA/RNA endonuclease YhcR with UshA esterase domain
MEVKSAALRGSVCFLNSQEDFKDARNFTVFLGKDALEKFREAKIEDPAAHFKGNTILVTGKVTLYRDKPQIAVDGPDQIKIEEKK